MLLYSYILLFCQQISVNYNGGNVIILFYKWGSQGVGKKKCLP